MGHSRTIVRRQRASRSTVDLVVLDQFVEQLKQIQEQAGFAKAAQDAQKVAHCFRFIKVNEAYIRAFIQYHDRDEAHLQHYFAFPKDRESKVIRDFRNTSFHVNHYLKPDGVVETEAEQEQRLNDCWDGLQAMVLEFESAITYLTQQHRLHEFIPLFTFSEDVGCLEERIARPMAQYHEWSGSVHPHLKSVIESRLAWQMTTMFQDTQKEMEDYHHIVKVMFPLLGQTVVIDEVAEDGKIPVEQTMLLTIDRLMAYLDRTYYTGTVESLDPALANQLASMRSFPPEKAIEIIDQRRGFVKTFSMPVTGQDADAVNLNHLINQLLHPETQRPVKDNRNQRRDRTWYWNPLTGRSDTRKVRSTRGLNKRAGYSYTKKTPVSLLPTHGQMPLFHVTEASVALLFDSDHCDLKGEKYIWDQNSVSNERFWLGGYTRGRQGWTSLRLAGLREKMAQQEGRSERFIRHNELLVGLSWASLQSVIATSDTLYSRLNALRVQRLLFHLTGINYPILIIYPDREKQIYPVENWVADLRAATAGHDERVTRLLACITSDVDAFVTEIEKIDFNNPIVSLDVAALEAVNVLPEWDEAAIDVVLNMPCLDKVEQSLLNGLLVKAMQCRADQAVNVLVRAGADPFGDGEDVGPMVLCQFQQDNTALIDALLNSANEALKHRVIQETILLFIRGKRDGTHFSDGEDGFFSRVLASAPTETSFWELPLERANISLLSEVLYYGVDFESQIKGFLAIHEFLPSWVMSEALCWIILSGLQNYPTEHVVASVAQFVGVMPKKASIWEGALLNGRSVLENIYRAQNGVEVLMICANQGVPLHSLMPRLLQDEQWALLRTAYERCKDFPDNFKLLFEAHISVNEVQGVHPCSSEILHAAIGMAKDFYQASALGKLFSGSLEALIILAFFSVNEIDAGELAVVEADSRFSGQSSRALLLVQLTEEFTPGNKAKRLKFINDMCDRVGPRLVSAISEGSSLEKVSPMVHAIRNNNVSLVSTFLNNILKAECSFEEDEWVEEAIEWKSVDVLEYFVLGAEEANINIQGPEELTVFIDAYGAETFSGDRIQAVVRKIGDINHGINKTSFNRLWALALKNDDILLLDQLVDVAQGLAYLRRRFTVVAEETFQAIMERGYHGVLLKAIDVSGGDKCLSLLFAYFINKPEETNNVLLEALSLDSIDQAAIVRNCEQNDVAGLFHVAYRHNFLATIERLIELGVVPPKPLKDDISIFRKLSAEDRLSHLRDRLSDFSSNISEPAANKLIPFIEHAPSNEMEESAAVLSVAIDYRWGSLSLALVFKMSEVGELISGRHTLWYTSGHDISQRMLDSLTDRYQRYNNTVGIPGEYLISMFAHAVIEDKPNLASLAENAGFDWAAMVTCDRYPEYLAEFFDYRKVSEFANLLKGRVELGLPIDEVVTRPQSMSLEEVMPMIESMLTEIEGTALRFKKQCLVILLNKFIIPQLSNDDLEIFYNDCFKNVATVRQQPFGLICAHQDRVSRFFSSGEGGYGETDSFIAIRDVIYQRLPQYNRSTLSAMMGRCV